MTQVMEIAKFKFQEGTDGLAAAAAIDAWLKAQPGYLDRVLIGPDADGTYTDMVRWRSMDDAHAAMATFSADPAVGALMAAVDPASVSMAHLAVVHAA